MMKFETKWRWFKRFTSLIALISGGIMALSFYRWDAVLFAVSISLLIGMIQLQMMIGFIDALNEEGE